MSMHLVFDDSGMHIGTVRGGSGIRGAVDAPEWYTGQPVYRDALGDVVAYTEAQAAAKAARPAYPARWSNTEMQWQDLRTLDDVRYVRVQAIKAARKVAEAGTFTVAGNTYQADEDSVRRLQIAAMAAQAGGAGWSTEWTLADNTTTTLTRAQMLAVVAGLFAHIRAQRDRASALRAQLDGALTVADVDAVSWPATP